MFSYILSSLGVGDRVICALAVELFNGLGYKRSRPYLYGFVSGPQQTRYFAGIIALAESHHLDH